MYKCCKFSLKARANKKNTLEYSIKRKQNVSTFILPIFLPSAADSEEKKEGKQSNRNRTNISTRNAYTHEVPHSCGLLLMQHHVKTEPFHQGGVQGMKEVNTHLLFILHTCTIDIHMNSSTFLIARGTKINAPQV